MFKKFYSITNHYESKYINRWLEKNPELYNDVDYVIMEKIHGANIQIVIDRDKYTLGKRTSMLANDEPFFDIHNTIKNKYLPFIKTIQGMIYEDSVVTLYGELYGKGIQKEVYYGEEKYINIFHMEIDNKPLSYFDMAHIFFLLTMSEWLVSPLAVVKGIKNALEFNTEFSSTFLHGELPERISSNLCEGVVIKPYKTVYMHDNGDNGIDFFMIKKKNSAFLEQKGLPKELKNNSINFIELNKIGETYINKNRINAVISKYGVINSPTQFGDYIKYTIEDARTDFIKDYTEKYNELNKDEQKQIVKTWGRLIKPYLEEVLRGN